MSIQKEYLTGKGLCLVKFSFSPDPEISSKKVFLVGDFNNWDRKQTPMIKRKGGSFSTVVELKIGNEYQFRYLIDETQWENDKEADKFVPSGYHDTLNSVVVI